MDEEELRHQIEEHVTKAAMLRDEAREALARYREEGSSSRFGDIARAKIIRSREEWKAAEILTAKLNQHCRAETDRALRKGKGPPSIPDF